MTERILKLNLPDPCKNKTNTFFYKFNLNNMDNRSACLGFKNVMDKAHNPLGKVSYSILTKTNYPLEETFNSISEIRSFFKNEFSICNGLETCMNLFWEDYE